MKTKRTPSNSCQCEAQRGVNMKPELILKAQAHTSGITPEKPDIVQQKKKGDTGESQRGKSEDPNQKKERVGGQKTLDVAKKE